MSTALDMTQDQRQKYIEGVRRRRPRQRLTPEHRSQWRAMLRSARDAADLLKTRFGAHRVTLFGSLAHGAGLARDSDVDLAVEGIGPGEYWQAWAAVESL